MSGFELLQVEASFWQRADVHRALEQRDIRTLFALLRQYVGASQQQIGTAIGVQQGTVSRITSGHREVTSIDVLERIATGLAMPDDARMRLGLAPRSEQVRRRTALGLGLVATISPAALVGVLQESAAEAVEFTRQRVTNTIGPEVLDHLTSVIAGLDRAYPWKPSAELFPLARSYRRYAEQLINGRHTLAEARELYVHAGYLSHILSDLAYNLGSTITAKAYAIDSYQLAEQAGHGELCAWAADSLAVSFRWTDQPAEMSKAALKGLRRVPRRHPLAARLHARAAEGYADQGNRDACTEQLTKARTACERLPDQMPSRFGTDRADHVHYSIAAYAGHCHVALEDWTEAERQSRTALGVGPWSRGRESGAHLNLGIALAHLGFPEEAGRHGKQAVVSGHIELGSHVPRARKLDAALTSRYPDEPATKEFHDHYQHLARQAITT